jgi:uncharacterized protein
MDEENKRDKPEKEKKDKKMEIPSAEELEVRIYSLATTANDAIIFLEELKGVRLLPIWIGPIEGQAIAIKFSGIPLPRPFTHDLIISFIKSTGYKIKKVVIDKIEENTFFASIHINKRSSARILDARPSDAIALAVRTGCKIFITSDVFDKAQTLNKPITQDEVKDFKLKLKDLKPADIFEGQLKKQHDIGSIKKKLDDEQKQEEDKDE